MKTLTFLATPVLSPKYRIKPGAVAMCLYFLAGLADGALMPFFALWAQHEAHIPLRFIGLLLACYAGGELIATPLLGGIADRLGRRPVLLLSTLGVGGGFLLLAHLHGVWAIALCLIGIGIFECALHPTIATVIADTAPADQLRMRYASARIASSLGHIVGPALGAALALMSLNTVFTGCGLSLLCASILIVGTLPETQLREKSPDVQEDEDEEGLSALLPAFRDPRLAAMLVWFAIIEIMGSWPEVITPLYAHGAHALTASGVGLLFTYAAAVVVILQWPVAKWSGKIAAFPLLIGAGATVAGGFGLLLLHANVFTLYASVTLLSLAQVLFGPLMPVAVNALAPPAARAAYMAAISTVNDVKDTAGPASGMYLYGLSARLPWLLGMPIAFLAALALAMTIKRSERAGGIADPQASELT
ncbi:MFS transporter [Dyella caseinilytica]|uniref:MFS transporter n=1 Tax=Dyella caseinilytica TaxID=1849581 RepID=A0ABX7GV17_9GAMM|nr:MFS transporter [Dyella caseinilytica]QRN53592.1 MFS transporter [Dyella caseinilytica]GFZ87726.1 MFS transporter [Dyella caseinilytica]